jgi:hypothetical protein
MSQVIFLNILHQQPLLAGVIHFCVARHKCPNSCTNDAKPHFVRDFSEPNLHIQANLQKCDLAALAVQSTSPAISALKNGSLQCAALRNAEFVPVIKSEDRGFYLGTKLASGSYLKNIYNLMQKGNRTSHADKHKRHAVHVKNANGREGKEVALGGTRRRAQNRRAMWEAGEVYDGE